MRFNFSPQFRGAMKVLGEQDRELEEMAKRFEARSKEFDKLVEKSRQLDDELNDNFKRVDQAGQRAWDAINEI